MVTSVLQERRAGDWILGAPLGGGGQAVVHRARHAITGTAAAVKIFHAEVWADPAFRVRVRREREALAALRHPHVVPILDFGEDESSGWIAMALAPGGTLAARLAAGPLAPEMALPVLRAIAAALDAAHLRGILHRDVTPANILLGPDGPWLADFGIARRTDATALTAQGLLLGTAGYVAPEVVSGERASAASDRYAFAAVAYEALTGRRVFAVDGVPALLYAHLHREPQLPSWTRPGLPDAVDAPLLRGLAKDPARRPRSARALVDALEAALAPGDGALPRPMTRVPAARPGRRRRARAAVLGAGIALALAGGGAVAVTAMLGSQATPEAAAPVAPVPPPPPTVPDGRGGEVLAAPARTADMPAPPPSDAVAAEVGRVRVASAAGGWAVLEPSRVRLAADGYTVEPLVADGRAIGLLARRPDLSDLTGQSSRWALLVERGTSGTRVLVVRGTAGAPQAYARRLAEVAGPRLAPAA